MTNMTKIAAERRLSLPGGKSMPKYYSVLPMLIGASAIALAAGSSALADETIAAGQTDSNGVTATTAAPDTFNLLIQGTLRNGGATNLTNTSVQGSGTGAVIITNEGRLQGVLNFTNATGAVTLNNNAGPDLDTQGWDSSGTSTFGSGADLIANGPDGVIMFTGVSTLNFGAGADRFVNEGRLITERSFGFSASAPGTLTLTGLETFENSGLILLGAATTANVGERGTITDKLANDRLIAQGVAFIGAGDSRIALGASLAAVTQAGCATAPTAADCVDFTGGSTAGSTLLTVRDVSDNQDGGALNSGIALIVGSSAAEHFSLDPNSDYYVETSSVAALQKRLVAYRLVYDAPNKTHKLVGVLADEAFQVATLPASMQETWRSSAGTWFSRQADLRSAPGGLRSSGGIWGRIAAGASDREPTSGYMAGPTTYSYDLSQRQRNASLVFGGDFLSAVAEDSAWVVGGMAGFVRSDIEYDATPTEVVSRGFTGGLYGSFLSGPLFIDGLVNINLLRLGIDAPNMNLAQNVSLDQDVKSLGGQIEAGWRFQVGNGFVEPLAAASYVWTKFDDMEIAGGGGGFDFDDKYESLRVAAGMRMGVDTALPGGTASYTLTGRYWTEREAEYATNVVVVGGPSLAQVTSTTGVVDDFSDGIAEITGAVALYSSDGGLSGFLNLGGKFGSDYRSVEGAIGVSMRW